MKSTDVIQPTAIKYPVAYAGTKNSIPLAATGSNLASITEGFPDITMQSVQDGGMPPFGQDFNGLFYLATDYKAYLQDGGYITFNETVSNLIGGYPQGAILDYYDANDNSYTKVVSLIDDNTYNFNTTPSYIDGTHWQDVNFGGANLSLSNLITAGENRLHALKGYLDNGTLLTDSTLFNAVYGYNHSTFDLSKFTVVGSPTVTDDGIASGFSNSNYLTASLSATSVNELRIKGKCQYSSIANSMNGSQVFTILQGTKVGSIEFVPSSNKIRLYNWLSNSETLAINYTLSDGDIFEYEIIANTTTITLNLLINNQEYTKSVNGNALSYIGSITGWQCTNTSGYYWTGSIDLKQFSVTVDGVPVFSGNKTGIDTIKPDDYTVVGTPTISADGIASGFSGSNFVRTGDVIDVSKPFKLHIAFDTLQGSSALETILSLVASGQTQYELRKDSNGSTLIIVYADSATTRSVVQINSVFADNNKYDVIIDSDGTNIKTYIGENGATPQLISTITPYIVTVLYVNLGISYLVSNPFAGSIDLNAFKIYVNGSLVYQPCLKIPYTESSTGSKVVDVAYRDRVIDTYEQFGKALYYTIDETNENATLPMGEVYGFIEQNKDDIAKKQSTGDWCITNPTTTSSATINKPSVIKENYVNGTSGYVVHSDGLIIQWGQSKLNGNGINFLKAFSDTNYNYHIRVNDNSANAIFNQYIYATKSTTGVTTFSLSGQWDFDWLAIGY